MAITVLFIAAFIPSVGVKVSPWHVEVHVLTYAFVGALTYWTLSNLKYYLLYPIIVMIPIAHEICEIWGHNHRLETHDIMIDLIGMGIGTLLAITTLKVINTIHSLEK